MFFCIESYNFLIKVYFKTFFNSKSYNFLWRKKYIIISIIYFISLFTQYRVFEDFVWSTMAFYYLDIPTSLIYFCTFFIYLLIISIFILFILIPAAFFSPFAYILLIFFVYFTYFFWWIKYYFIFIIDLYNHFY